MGRLSTETKVRVILRKTKGVHWQQIVKHPEYAGYVFSPIAHGRDLPLDTELVQNQASTNLQLLCFIAHSFNTVKQLERPAKVAR